jgi:hypothetical protein
MVEFASVHRECGEGIWTMLINVFAVISAAVLCSGCFGRIGISKFVDFYTLNPCRTAYLFFIFKDTHTSPHQYVILQ